MKNNNLRPFIFLLFVSLIIIPLSFIPSFSIGGYEVKTINFISDLQKSTRSSIKTEKLVIDTIEHNITKYKCPEGITCIEDYGQDKPSGMSSFYKSLAQCDSLNRPVRIAYFGDSFVEGDILTADLREMLQQKFGGCGVGYLSIAPECPGFRKSVSQFSDGWETHQTIDTEGFIADKQSIAQTYAHPNGYSYTNIRANNTFSCASRFETSTFYLISSYPVTINVSKNGEGKETITSKGTGKVEALSVHGDMTQIRWEISGGNDILCHGVAVECNKGIVLDNLAMRSSSGMHLLSLNSDYLKQINEVRPYDLIILHYGLNIVNKHTMEYDGYVKRMSQFITKLKECFPNTSILITSVGDREDKINGNLHTMPSILSLIQYQQKMAADNEVAFWNLYNGMGGEGSIVKMTEMKPAEAQKDYTHITRKGGKTLAEQYFKAIMAGYEQYKIIAK